MKGIFLISLYSPQQQALNHLPFSFYQHTRLAGPARAAFAKTRSRALTSRQIITAHRASIMLLNSQKGVQLSNWTPQLIH